MYRQSFHRRWVRGDWQRRGFGFIIRTLVWDVEGLDVFGQGNTRRQNDFTHLIALLSLQGLGGDALRSQDLE